ncbi:MAG: 3-hydroxybutyryl-CoA dehydrogenase [Polyangiales bacterium]
MKCIGVVGAGQMGQGIAQVAAQSGLDVVLVDAFEGVAERGRDRIAKILEGLVQKGKLEANARDATLARLFPSRELSSLADVDFVVEAATENVDVKLGIFRELDGIVKPSGILASNTSSISITKIAGVTKRPDRVVGMHFFNPVPLMKLVEIVRALQTSDETHAFTRALAERMGKQVITARDTPGFIVNRVLVPLVIEACFELEAGIASPEDIDLGARLGLNHPMGPLELADLVGLDTLLAIADVLHREFGDSKYRAPVLLRNYVAAGWHGKKAGRGFYVYDEKGNRK